MKEMRAIILLILLLGVTNLHAQSKKELQEKYEKLQNQNLKLEKSNTLLNAQVENLTERMERLEKELATAKAATKSALIAKETALKQKDAAEKSKEVALQAQIKTLKSKEALFEEKGRMEAIFEREVKAKSSLRQMSIAGRYYIEGNAAKEGEYIELFEDGTLLTVPSKNEKDNILESVGGTYNLKGNRITLILSIFTMTKAVDATISGNRLILQEKGKDVAYIREK